VRRDHVFAKHHPEIAEFTFSDGVASVFRDMLQRSVPGYGTVLSLLSILAKRYVQEESNIYDLGCSLGASTFALAQNLTVNNCSIFAYDTSEPMLDRFRALLTESPLNYPVTIEEQDICETHFENSSFTVLNLTLQFVDPEERTDLLQKIYDGTRPGGVLILVEKISDDSENEVMTDIYYDFKSANRYSQLEISQKRTALENVLITDSEEVHLERLETVGFKKHLRILQTLNFRAYIAWK